MSRWRMAESADVPAGPDITRARDEITAGRKDDEDDGHILVPCEPDDRCSPAVSAVSATPQLRTP
jgi:hypothetical protein